MKKYFKLLLLIVVFDVLKANYPATDSIACVNADTFIFESETSEGRWRGTLSITGTLMLTQQMHSIGERLLSPTQFYLYRFVQKHLRSNTWKWRYDSGTVNQAIYTSIDTHVILKLILDR